MSTTAGTCNACGAAVIRGPLADDRIVTLDVGTNDAGEYVIAEGIGVLHDPEHVVTTWKRFAEHVCAESSPLPWTEAHRREAAAVLLLHGSDPNDLGEETQSEYAFRCALVCAELADIRINREVRRVRALAEGRLVRSVRYRAESEQGDEKEYIHREQAAQWLGDSPGRTIRVTRIRRA